MLYTLFCYDGPDGGAIRARVRDEHLAYLRDAGTRVKLAGPLLCPGDDPKPIGSMILIDAASEAAVKLFAENDPYARAGVFERVDIHPWRPVLGDWAPKETDR
ncbi:YciI family protein [Eilatimonas milleporae]|uniref:YCII-related domain-containing protein n=1 Tax=Eilatimonas milleporae TaxID=911205 RepID=A0A3M0CC11_9PROT|nr:YciI family protein [Eilatimonas milleporae]RMB00563.1 hypothetical protein BXY39_3750 [Eilatimonas milleporae]